MHEKVYFPHLYNDILVLRAQEDENENQLFLIQHSLYRRTTLMFIAN